MVSRVCMILIVLIQIFDIFMIATERWIPHEVTYILKCVVVMFLAIDVLILSN